MRPAMRMWEGGGAPRIQSEAIEAIDRPRSILEVRENGLDEEPTASQTPFWVSKPTEEM